MDERSNFLDAFRFKKKVEDPQKNSGVKIFFDRHQIPDLDLTECQRYKLPEMVTNSNSNRKIKTVSHFLITPRRQKETPIV